LARELDRPPTRAEINRALVLNAATKPVNIVVPAAIAVVGIVLGFWWIALVVAIPAFVALCVVTYLDGDEAAQVGDELRGKRAAALPQVERLDPSRLAPPIAKQVSAALQEEQHIRQAIEQADLPLTEVSSEVDGLVRALETMAKRAQTLWDYLASQDPPAIEARIAQLERDGGAEGKPICDALRQQLEALASLRKQLDKFFAQMEHIVASLGTMNAQVLRMSLVTETDSEDQLAGQARELREQVNALADGMSEVYQRADDAAVAAPSGPAAPASPPGS
jgi:hypothetical protein